MVGMAMANVLKKRWDLSCKIHSLWIPAQATKGQPCSLMAIAAKNTSSCNKM